MSYIVSDWSKVADAIRECDGNLSEVCRRLSISRTTIWKWVNEHPELQEAVAEARERNLDELEDSMYRRAKEGSDRLLIFALSTQGRDRGYGNMGKIEVDTRHSGAVAIEVNPKAEAIHISRVMQELEKLDNVEIIEGTFTLLEDRYGDEEE